MRSLRPLFFAWLSTASILALAGCGFTGDADDRAGSWLVMNNLAEASQLDPGMITTVEDQRICLALFEGLVSHDPKTLAPIPGVAERWELSEDKKRYRFHLRECLWSQGDPITASDFVYAWRRVLTPPTDDAERRGDQGYFVVAPYVDAMFCVKGAEAWYRGELKDFSKVGVRALDERTLEVELENPTPWFLELLCFPTFMPVHRPTVERHRESWTRAENIVGNGAFRLERRRLGDSLTVVRNKNYWDAASVGLDGIVYETTDQMDTALDQYLAGESDWVRGFNPKKVRAWRADPKLKAALRAPEYLGTYFYRLNVQAAPLDDVRVRRALSLSIDREAITRYVTGLGEEAATGIVPPCAGAFVEWQGKAGIGLFFDPERARSELSAAGFPDGKNFPELVLAYNTDIKNKAIAEAIQQMWRRELGIRVQLENREKRVHITAEKAGRYQISRGSWVGDYSDPMTFLEFMESRSANNRTGWKNEAYDALISASRSARDERTRLDALAEAEVILTDLELPLIPLYFFRTAYVLRPGRFDGIYENGRDLHPPKYIRRRGGA